MATNLPTDIAATYPDASPGDAQHQAHHDAIHGALNELAASTVPFTPAGNIAATDVQAAIQELDTEKATSTHAHAVPRARAGLAAYYPVATATTVTIPLDTEAYDTNGMHSTTVNPSRVTFDRAGAWLVIGQLGYRAGVSATGRRIVMVSKNGIEISRAVSFPTTTAIPTAQTTVVTDAVAGDYVELLTYQDSGSTIDLQYDYVYLAVSYLGP